MSFDFRFKPRSAGLESILGELERPIMEVIWATENIGVSEVTARLGRDHAYTTVKTVMERLEKKGYLLRHKVGRAYHYSAALGREALEGRASRGVIDGLLGAFGSSALAQFAAAVGEDPARLAELRALLDALPDNTDNTEVKP
jgi:BlaI family transcriptional regulator, penicillinase repressor